MKDLSPSGGGNVWLRLALRLGALALSLLLLGAFGPRLCSLLAPFLLAALAARCLHPAVGWLCRKTGLRRGTGALLVLLLVLSLLSALVWAAGTALADELAQLTGSWEEALFSFEALWNGVEEAIFLALKRLPPSVRAAVSALTARFFAWLENAVPSLLAALAAWTADRARGLPSLAVSAVVFVLATCFITADYPRLRAGAARALPPEVRHGLFLLKRGAAAGFFGYLKAQALLSGGVFCLLLAGLFLMGQPYALLLSLILAVLDFIPLLGAGTALVPWAMAALLTGDRRRALALTAVWALVTLFRQGAEPKVLGGQTGLSPLLSLIVVYGGMKLAGVPGMVLAPMVCLAARSLYASGVLDPALADLRLAAGQAAAFLKRTGFS